MIWFRTVFLLLVCAGAVRAADWPQWLGPKRDGSTTEKVAGWSEKEPPKLLWRQTIGQAFSSPIVAEGRSSCPGRGHRQGIVEGYIHPSAFQERPR
jgi:hypothetical protein